MRTGLLIILLFIGCNTFANGSGTMGVAFAPKQSSTKGLKESVKSTKESSVRSIERNFRR